MNFTASLTAVSTAQENLLKRDVAGIKAENETFQSILNQRGSENAELNLMDSDELNESATSEPTHSENDESSEIIDRSFHTGKVRNAYLKNEAISTSLVDQNMEHDNEIAAETNKQKNLPSEENNVHEKEKIIMESDIANNQEAVAIPAREPVAINELEKDVSLKLVEKMAIENDRKDTDLFFSESRKDEAPQDIRTNEMTSDEIVPETDHIPFEALNQTLFQQMAQLMEQIHLLKESSPSTNRQEMASNIVALLEKWHGLKAEMNEGELDRYASNALTDKDFKIWKQVANAFAKRLHFANRNLYLRESTVSKTDVMNWLQQAVQNYAEPIEEKATVHMPMNQPLPLSETQQYMIHLQQSHRVEPVSEQLLHKFEAVIRNSQFLKPNANINQLSIMLQPEHLGNMTLRLMQAKGEMTVKIIVSSQMAKEMLESNIHQLKHLFSPHQVTIERDDTVSDEKFLMKEHEKEQQEENEANDSNEEAIQEDDDEAAMNFEELFESLREEVLKSE